MDINQKLLNALITRHIDLMRYETSVRAEVFAKLDEMQDDVWGFVLSGSLKKVEHIITQGYELLLKMWDVLPVFSAEMAWLSATLGGLAVAYKLKDKIVPFAQNKLKDLADKFTIGGLTLPESVAKQRDDLVRKLKQIVRFAKIDDVLPSSDDVQAEFDRAKSSLKTLSKTWINSAIHTAHDAFAKVNPMIKGFRHVSTLDGKTSSVCTHRNGLLWDKKHNPIGHAELFKRPPLHPNCRSKMVYVYDLNKPFDGMTGAEWVKSRSLEQLQEQFGKGIGQMLFDGQITLADALDGLKPLTLKQLQEKLGLPETVIAISGKHSWSDEFKQRATQIYFDFERHGMILDIHGVTRFTQRFEHLAVDDVANWVLNSEPRYTEQNENGQSRLIWLFEDKQLAVVKSTIDNQYISFIKRKNASDKWQKIN